MEELLQELEKDETRLQAKKEEPLIKKLFKKAEKEGYFWVSFVPLFEDSNILKIPLEKYLTKPKNKGPKPLGNLTWVSSLQTKYSDYYGSSWYSYQKNTDPRWITLNGESKHALLGYIVDYSKLYFIDSRRKLLNFHKKYVVDDSVEQPDIDWARVSRDYSGVAFYPYDFYAYSAFRPISAGIIKNLDEAKGRFLWYTMFDTNQIVIWDIDAIKEYKVLYMPK